MVKIISSLTDRFRGMLPNGSTEVPARWWTLVEQIQGLQVGYTGWTESELFDEWNSLRYRVQSGESLTELLPEAFAIISEQMQRHLGMTPYPVQYLGAIAMHEGTIAEMQTGEGKTLTAALTLCLNALPERGIHIATANDYLAERDARWLSPVYHSLGMTVGTVTAASSMSERRAAYECDITYGTAREFGFDYLRDLLNSPELKTSTTVRRQQLFGQKQENEDQGLLNPRTPYMVVIDEADSILIDEARTPLIIGQTDLSEARLADVCQWSAAQVSRLEESEHFIDHGPQKGMELTEAGRRVIRELLLQPAAPHSLDPGTAYLASERALKVDSYFQQGRDYVVREGKVAIVDEFTGRIAEGRMWQNGIHQAIEAKEGVEITSPTKVGAQTTVQELFARYTRMAGMTGTAASARSEFKKVFGTPVITIPTNRPGQRALLSEQVFLTAEEKWTAIVEETAALHRQGRPVLIGTRSVNLSNQLAARLEAAGLEHEVLHALNHENEAAIIEQAGQPGRITVATNMAGRGTDILLGEGVAAEGGLHVICSELHESTRIDRQLTGRAARQGDPGSARVFLSLEDDILASGLGAEQAAALLADYQRAGRELQSAVRHFYQAQSRVEKRHERQRVELVNRISERRQMLQQMGQHANLNAH
ncbi:preprotein translocase subunit SecA [Gimesia panareensis]|uniref:Protein translocase subunit SecA n=1 Tax=Gimesia panareensis TaxID=2527978 RepID=A0A517QGB0_9PLAN|nr:preprotein translocase subunit SecA [Gimesia panareensis]